MDTPDDGVVMTDRSNGAEKSTALDLTSVPYKECIRRAEEATARIAACDDIDEHVRLVKEADRYIREVQTRIDAAEGDIRRILGKQ